MLWWGIESLDLFLFLKQVGLALAGAAALWGFIFLFQSRFKEQRSSCLIFVWISEKMFVPLMAGGLLTLLSWALLTMFSGIYAHEGISIAHSIAEKEQAFLFVSPWLALWFLALLATFFVKRFWPDFFLARTKFIYAFHLIFVVALMVLPAFAEDFQLNREMFSTIAHSTHSVLTLGTILILDFLFLYSASSLVLKQHIYPMFLLFSKFIWIGLGIDFLSSALVFSDGVALSAKFFFAQTVTAILILNGVFLGGPIGRMLEVSVRKGGAILKSNWRNIAHVSGIVSVSSWSTITFVDIVGGITLNYSELFIFYGLFIAALVAFHSLFGRFAGTFLKERLMGL